MGSCCSCCAPAAAQRYEVNDLHDEAEEQAAVQHVPAVVPRDVTPPRPGGSIVPQKLLQRDSPEEELAVVAAPPPPPATPRLANEYARAIDKKETAYRAKILSEEFTDRSALDVQRRWWGDRILDLAAQEDLLEEQRRQHQQLTALASNVDRSGRISPTDLRAAVMVEEFIIAPAAFQSRNMLAESGTGSMRPPSVSDSLTLRLSPLKTRNSINAAGDAGGRMFSTPIGDPIDDVLSATMDDDDARPFYTPPPKLDFHAPQWDDGLSTNSPWRYGALNPFDHGVRMEMVQYLAMFSASPQRMPFQRSMIREINHDRPHSRGDVVQAGDPLLGVVLDEVDGRDVIERYRRHEGFEVGLLEAQERGIRTHMEYGRSLLQLRMDCWTLWLIRFEHHQRMVMEQERFHAVLRLWSGADKRITLRRAYENQLIAAADRAVNRGVRQADAATLASGQQRKVDKLKWDVEKSRLKKPMISAKETFVEKLRAIHAAAPHDATTGVSRARHAQLLSMHMLDIEEERWRDAVALEEKRRWSDIIDLIISLSPSLICAPDLNSILSAKQQARLIAAQLELQKLEKRLEAVFFLPIIYFVPKHIPVHRR
ncbi:Hypothetical protein, putative [Bodo saltans]|uniref:Uncharacterized protein n=1 Tax=Bodo saltans TaxID=75058 RepID=A0A0S4IKC5_BODSA|nr:Hypothetical protein, putative [Bodo saltans]|eukprot:CUE65243.1 Hypothetical protein, putative [Bodo saltans]